MKTKEFEISHIGGPADGMVTVVNGDPKALPEVHCLELFSQVNPETPLGAQYLKKRNPSKTKVGVYVLKEHQNNNTPIQYYFVEMLSLKEYLDKYREDEEDEEDAI